MNKKKLNHLLSQEFTRQEFLKAGGAMLLMLIGLPAILNSVTKAFSSTAQSKIKNTSAGQGSTYSGRPYGR